VLDLTPRVQGVGFEEGLEDAIGRCLDHNGEVKSGLQN